MATTLTKLKSRVRSGELAPMEALNLLVRERKADRDPPRKLWDWVEQRIELAKRQRVAGEWIRGSTR